MNIWVLYSIFFVVGLGLILLNSRLLKITEKKGWGMIGFGLSAAGSAAFGIVSLPVYILPVYDLADARKLFFGWICFLGLSIVFTVMGWVQIVKKFGSRITFKELKAGKKEITEAKKISDEIEEVSTVVQDTMRHKI